MNNMSSNQPLYLYQEPMFRLTVSVVVIIENGVIVRAKDNNTCCFPCDLVRAGRETVQFAAVRQIREKLGIFLTKEALIPVDFRSDPDRSTVGNEVDIGLMAIIDDIHPDSEIIKSNPNIKWMEVNFETGELIKNNFKMIHDHDLLLNRAVDVMLMMKG